MDKITKNATKWFATDVKRFHLPVTVESSCPECELVQKRNLENQNYLSYPVLGATQSVGFYCDYDDCGAEWEVKVKLEFTLELV